VTGNLLRVEGWGCRLQPGIERQGVYVFIYYFLVILRNKNKKRIVKTDFPNNFLFILNYCLFISDCNIT
jgi:hypothetical protein